MSIEFEFDPIRLSQYERYCNCNSQNCRCGENNVHEWAWDEEHAAHTTVLSEHNLGVTLNNVYSTGTTAVRGNQPLEKGRHHYWEVKILSPIYGTDTMVGVGTSNLDLNSKKNVYCSFLGLDKESLGFSYNGYVQQDGVKRNYGACFGQGSLVGVYLDTWKGTLGFFLNKKSLGIAFTGLRNITLYPMVSSTVANSKIRLVHSYSMPASLQAECLAVLKPSHRTYLSTTFSTLRYLSESIFAEILMSESKDNDDEKACELDFLTDCMIFDDFDFALVAAGRRKKRK